MAKIARVGSGRRHVIAVVVFAIDFRSAVVILAVRIVRREPAPALAAVVLPVKHALGRQRLALVVLGLLLEAHAVLQHSAHSGGLVERDPPNRDRQVVGRGWIVAWPRGWMDTDVVHTV